MKKPIPFGKYQLLERVNVGGMAEVFKAKAFGVEGFERLVAVKRILPSIAEDRDFITMFIDEAKIAVQLSHANIAQIFDLGKVAESYFIAMEFMHGKDMRAIFDRARKRGEAVPVQMACYVIMKVCEGLDYAHNKRDAAGRDLNLVHRDVSPQNILISYDGEVKLIDFGIAKAANKASKTQAGILKGKFGYMSPEQVRGLPIDRRSDLFSVGIVLYELLTGERLFVGESDFSTLEKVRNVDIMPPSTYNRKIPEELEQIVLKALSKEAEDRYQTAMDLHDDLQSFMYTSGNFFARKDLSAYMRKAFSDDIAKESARDEEYRQMEAHFDVDDPPTIDEQVHLRPAVRRAAHVARSSVPPPPPPVTKRQPKRTMLGMGVPAIGGPPPSSVPPPPPRARSSVPPPLPSPSAPPGIAPPMAGPPSEGPSAGGRAAGMPPAPPDFFGGPPSPGPAPGFASGPGGHAFDMDWDEEELATQVYDKAERPEPGSEDYDYPPNDGRAFTDPDPFEPFKPTDPGPFSHGVPPEAGPSPSAPPPPESPRRSEPRSAPPSPATRSGSEPTELTSRDRGPRDRGAIAALVVAAAVLVCSIAVAVWVVWPAKKGSIVLRTEPREVTVRVDGELQPGTRSPFRITSVEPDKPHTVEVSAEGYARRTELLELEPGERYALDVELEPEGKLFAAAKGISGTGFTLDTVPSGAEVFVDGRQLDQVTPVQVTDLKPGPHTIRAERGSRYVPWQIQIDVREGEVQALSRAVLSRKSVLVRFRSDPSGAEVTLRRGREEREVGETPATAEVDVTGESWRVLMEREGYESWSETLEVKPGEDEVTVEADLDPGRGDDEREARRERHRSRPRASRSPHSRRAVSRTSSPVAVAPPAAPAPRGQGTLQIGARPWAQVYVDGRLIGNTPQMGIKVSAGRHQVMLVNPDFNLRKSFPVDVPAGGVVREVKDLTQ